MERSNQGHLMITSTVLEHFNDVSCSKLKHVIFQEMNCKNEADFLICALRALSHKISNESMSRIKTKAIAIVEKQKMESEINDNGLFNQLPSEVMSTLAAKKPFESKWENLLKVDQSLLRSVLQIGSNVYAYGMPLIARLHRLTFSLCPEFARASKFVSHSQSIKKQEKIVNQFCDKFEREIGGIGGIGRIEWFVSRSKLKWRENMTKAILSCFGPLSSRIDLRHTKIFSSIFHSNLKELYVSSYTIIDAKVLSGQMKYDSDCNGLQLTCDATQGLTHGNISAMQAFEKLNLASKIDCYKITNFYCLAWFIAYLMYQIWPNYSTPPLNGSTKSLKMMTHILLIFIPRPVPFDRKLSLFVPQSAR